VCQIQYNFMDTEVQAGTAGLRYLGEKGLAVVIMEPLRGGRLAQAPEDVQEVWDSAPVQRTPAEWALRWVWDDPDVDVVLSGMGTLEQVKENVRSADEGEAGTLSQEELALFGQVRQVYLDRTKIPCTACRYCMPCPTGINIPLVFELYNDAALYGNEDREKMQYQLSLGMGSTVRASACSKCFLCLDKCPQHINVTQGIIDAAEMLEG